MDISCLARHSIGLRQPRAPLKIAPTPSLYQGNFGKIHRSLEASSMLFFRRCYALTPKGASTMEWVTPQHEVIDLNCEVSSYANAEL